MNRILLPCCWKIFTEIYFVKMCAKIIILHPPVSIILKLVSKLFFKSLVIVPCFIIICKFSCPFSLTPWISNSYQLKSINFSNLLNTISMVKKNSRISHSFFRISIFIFNCVCTANKKSLLIILF